MDVQTYQSFQDSSFWCRGVDSLTDQASVSLTKEYGSAFYPLDTGTSVTANLSFSLLSPKQLRNKDSSGGVINIQRPRFSPLSFLSALLL